MMTDEMLRLAAAEADCILCDSLLATMEKEHTFSARFERRMNRLIRRTNHPVFYPVLRQAACFLLLLILAGTTWLTVDIQARAAFFAWVRQQYEAFTEYRFVASAPDSIGLDLYEPAWLPEGFEKQKQAITDTTSMIVYTDSNDRMISLLYSQGADAVSLFIIPEDAAVQTVSVNGQPADFYLESDPESANGLVWTSETGDILFCLTAPPAPRCSDSDCRKHPDLTPMTTQGGFENEKIVSGTGCHTGASSKPLPGWLRPNGVHRTAL